MKRVGVIRRGLAVLAAIGLVVGWARADDDAPGPPAVAPKVGSEARMSAAPITRLDPPSEDAAGGTPVVAPPVHFSADALWQVAGYNNEEIVYTIVLKNLDTTIIRCLTQIHGWYIENGQKLSIDDRQSTTVLPGEQAQAGNWLGMDQQSGASYSVKCRAL